MVPALMLAFFDWRKGLFITIVVAMLQDPLRKLTPDQPTYYVVLVGAVFVALWLGAFLRRLPLSPNRIDGWKQKVSIPLALLLLLISVQAVNAYARFGNYMLPAIGMLSYITPILALVVGYQFAVRGGTRSIIRWVRFYLTCAVVMLVSVYLEYAGLEWTALGELGTGIGITDMGTVLTAHAGFFRASEIAAWHTAAAACFFVLIGTEKRISLSRILRALVITAFLIGIGVLTGRRKMVVEVVMFIMTYLSLIFFFHKRSLKFAALFLSSVVVVYVGIVGIMDPDKGERDYEIHRYQLYVDRSKNVIEQIPDRLSNLGIEPVKWAIDSFGLFGAGLGTGSQGTQHFGGGAAKFGGAAEGGLGKITMELGVPGLILSLWLSVVVTKLIWKILETVSQKSARVARLSYGFVAFLVANAAAFSVATQAYGDVFILLFLGFTIGFILAMPILAERESQEQQRTVTTAKGFRQSGPPYPSRISTSRFR